MIDIRCGTNAINANTRTKWYQTVLRLNMEVRLFICKFFENNIIYNEYSNCLAHRNHKNSWTIDYFKLNFSSNLVSLCLNL